MSRQGVIYLMFGWWSGIHLSGNPLSFRNPMKKLQTVCIIDDNSIDCLITEKLIKRANPSVQVIVFSDARSALVYLKESAIHPEKRYPDVIFLDLNMPDMNGWGFMDEFDKLPATLQHHCTVYMLSSCISPVDIARAKNYQSIVEYLVKPLSKQTILEKLNLTNLAG
jgi:CheY-like chemotaxis protein